MRYSRLGRSKLSVYGLYTTLNDTITAQCYTKATRQIYKTLDTYKVYATTTFIRSFTDKDNNTVNVVTGSEVCDFYIEGKVITHEIGDSQSDCNLHSAVLESVPFYEQQPTLWKAEHYDYQDIAYPKLLCYLRAAPFQTLTEYRTLDLIELQYNARNFLNPYVSIQQTPTETDDTYTDYTVQDDEIVTHSESIQLAAPLNSKFRRLRVEFVCYQTSVVRSIVINYNVHSRKGYG